MIVGFECGMVFPSGRATIETRVNLFLLGSARSPVLKKKNRARSRRFKRDGGGVKSSHEFSHTESLNGGTKKNFVGQSRLRKNYSNRSSEYSKRNSEYVFESIGQIEYSSTDSNTLDTQCVP